MPSSRRSTLSAATSHTRSALPCCRSFAASRSRSSAANEQQICYHLLPLVIAITKIVVVECHSNAICVQHGSRYIASSSTHLVAELVDVDGEWCQQHQHAHNHDCDEDSRANHQLVAHNWLELLRGRFISSRSLIAQLSTIRKCVV